MAGEIAMQDVADRSVEDLRSFISTERQLTTEEHSLALKLYGIDNILMHLNEAIPEELKPLQQLNFQVTEKILEIREMLDAGILSDLKIIKEEEAVSQSFKGSLKHGDWKAVKTMVAEEEADEGKALRLEQDELFSLHKKFLDLMALIKKSRVLMLEKEELETQKEKNHYMNTFNYYFLQIYKFARAYEKILRDLWEKELLLSRRLKANSSGTV